MSAIPVVFATGCHYELGLEKIICIRTFTKLQARIPAPQLKNI